MSSLKLYLLGSPLIERDGEPVKVDTRKAIALVAYLAVTGTPHGRDALAALLWPESDLDRARAALRRTLSALNKALAGEGLVSDRQGIGLGPSPGVWTDVDEFHSGLASCEGHGHPSKEVCFRCTAPLAEAVRTYRGDFMVGFTLRDSPEFDDWQYLQSESMRLELAGALERLATCQVALGEYTQAVDHGRRWLALDPLQESAHRFMMRVYSWSGQRSLALRQYRECVRVLDRELGVAPLEETGQVYEAVKETRLAAPPSIDLGEELHQMAGVEATARAPFGLPASRHTSPMVGRSAEWHTMLQSYESIADDGRLFVLEGEAGIGKTRLAEAFLGHVRNGGRSTIAARCYEGEAEMAYGPFVEGLRTAIESPQAAERLAKLDANWLAEASRLVPELAGFGKGLMPSRPLDSPGAQTYFLEGLSQTLVATCGPRGVLFLDDLHWADDASLDLLTYLVRRFKGKPVCVLAAWRTEGLTPDHRLRSLAAEAERNGSGTALTLSRLGEADVAALVDTIRQAGTDLPEGLHARLYAETEGLPFFVAEYLAAMSADVSERGRDDWEVPGGVRDLLLSRLATASETGRQLLTAAAVIGRSFSFDALRGASGRSEEEAVSALEELTQRGLIREVGGGESPAQPVYDFSHERLRALVGEETSFARRRLIHRRVGEALALGVRNRHDIGPLAGQIARHFQLSGEEAEAARYFGQAGEHSRSLYANKEATAHFESALALGHPEIAWLHESLGDLHTLSGEYSAALASYETAAALYEPEAPASVEHKLGAVHHRRGDWELAESHFESALASMAEDGPLGPRARVYADWSLTSHIAARSERALELADRALVLAESGDDTDALAQANNILGILAKSRGDLDDATRYLERSLSLAESVGDLSGARVAALNNMALVQGERGETDRALQMLKTAVALAASQGDRHREAALHNNLSDLLHKVGRPDDGMAHLEQAVTIFAEIGQEAGDMQPEIWKLVEW